MPASASSIADACENREGYTDQAPPTRIFGDTWYIGTCGITVVMIKTAAGLALIDGGPAKAPPMITASLRRLGYDIRQVRWILSSHQHDDHAGGIVELQRLSGAKLIVGPEAAQVLRTGEPDPDDPQYGELHRFAPPRVDRVLKDGQTIDLGGVAITAHDTPAHMLGSTSWTWRSCAKRICRAIALTDSLTTISVPGYRFTDHPQRIAEVRRGFATAAELPCDILVTPHPGASDLIVRLAGRAPLVNADACRAYAAAASQRFEQRLASEAAVRQ